jgi:hypothetical protein
MRLQVAEFAILFREATFGLFRLLSEVRGSEVRGPTVTGDWFMCTVCVS